MSQRTPEREIPRTKWAPRTTTEFHQVLVNTEKYNEVYCALSRLSCNLLSKPRSDNRPTMMQLQPRTGAVRMQLRNEGVTETKIAFGDQHDRSNIYSTRTPVRYIFQNIPAGTVCAHTAPRSRWEDDRN